MGRKIQEREMGRWKETGEKVRERERKINLELGIVQDFLKTGQGVREGFIDFWEELQKKE